MPNIVDEKIHDLTQEHVRECEKLNVSRNVTETARRIDAALKEFSRFEVMASGYWTSLHDQAKVMAIRDAVLELAEKLEKLGKGAKSPAPVAAEPAQVELEDAIEDAPKPAKKAKPKKVAMA